MASWKEPKDPNEVLDYQLDWQPPPDPKKGKIPRLDDADTIITSEWVDVTAGIVVNSDEIYPDLTKTKIWLSGGTANVDYSMTNRITTAGGRTMDQTMVLQCRVK